MILLLFAMLFRPPTHFVVVAAWWLSSVSGFILPPSSANSAFRNQARCNEHGADEAVDSAPSVDAPETDAPDPVAAIVGLSGVASTASAASTAAIATTAGGVCASGACAAGAGAALAGGTGGTAAVTAGGFLSLAGAKALLVGGALAAGAAFNGFVGAPTLDSMVRASMPLEVAAGNGRPTVVEFYGSGCPHCHEAAKRLLAVEEAATRSKGINWVMINTDDPRTEPLWTRYHVDELPHFEFLDAKGYEVGFVFGEVDADQIDRRITEAATHAADAFGSLNTAVTP